LQRRELRDDQLTKDTLSDLTVQTCKRSIWLGLTVGFSTASAPLPFPWTSPDRPLCDASELARDPPGPVARGEARCALLGKAERNSGDLRL